MAHNIQAFISLLDCLEKEASKLETAHIVSLPQGFAMLPVTDTLRQEAATIYPSQEIQPFEEFYDLTDSVARLGAQMSRHTPVTYIETEYWGGDGTQAAVIWHRGKVVLRPYMKELDWRQDQVSKLAVRRGPVSIALSRLGVKVDKELDEYAALGLGRFRSNEDWIEQPTWGSL